jgi:preprotein translocase subunit Sec61beta
MFDWLITQNEVVVVGAVFGVVLAIAHRMPVISAS